MRTFKQYLLETQSERDNSDFLGLKAKALAGLIGGGVMAGAGTLGYGPFSNQNTAITSISKNLGMDPAIVNK